MSLYLKSDGLYYFNMRAIGNIYSEHTFEKIDKDIEKCLLVFNNCSQNPLRCMAVAEEFGEGDLSPGKLAISCHNPAVICIGDSPGAMLNNFYPFRLRAENDAGALKEKGLFLYAAAICHYNAGIFLQSNHIKE